MIISISGRIGAGKSAVASIIKELYPEMNWQEKGFADKLREVVSIMTGIPVESMKDQEVKQRFLPKFNMTLRQLLQKVGEDFRRINEDVWVDALMTRYKPTWVHSGVEGYPWISCEIIPDEDVASYAIKNYQNWLLPDARHVNELEAITSRNGTCIRIVRPDNPYPASNHASETSLDHIELLTIINDGNLDQLRIKAKEVFDPIVHRIRSGDSGIG